MKKFLFTIVFLCSGIVFAQYTDAPKYEFKSTSNYQYTNTQHQYTIPVAMYDLQEPYTSKTPYTPVQQYGNGNLLGTPMDPNDPGWENVPIGELDIYIILGILLSYFVLYYLKKRKQ